MITKKLKDKQGYEAI